MNLVKPKPTNPAAQAAGFGYRPDIDGLRAIAVLSVVLYHINNSLVPGGFVGVDIFFVISGFLITRNIHSEMLRGNFSLSKFYIRRIHRIYPAFAAVVLATLLAGALLMLPDDMAALARSASWAAFSLPNVYFWRYLDTSYFAPDSGEQPLLHMWSLGVEEQFYFLWPAVLMLSLWLFKKNRRGAMIVALAIAIFSFAYAQRFLVSAPKFTYYMLPPRAGELMVGALLALRPAAATTLPRNRIWGEVFAAVGVALTAYSLWQLDSESPFPGINSLWPCLGAAALIVAGQNDSWFSRRVLSLRGMVFTGLISYSLYLWHWPILAFLRYFQGDVAPVPGAIAAFAMLLLAWLSYRYIETPFRRWRPSARVSFGAVWGIPLIASVVASAVIIQTNGLEKKIESNSSYTAAKAAIGSARSSTHTCQTSVTDKTIFDQSRCIIGAPAKGEPKVLLWGDSKAAQYVGLLDEIGKANDISIRNAEHSSCPPVFFDNQSLARTRQSCNHFWRLVQKNIRSREYDIIIMSGAWRVYDTSDSFRYAFKHTLKRLLASNAHLVFLSDVPQYRGYNRYCTLRSTRAPWAIDCKRGMSEISAKESDFEKYLANVALNHPGRISFINMKRTLCPDGTCRAWVNDMPLYYDIGHLGFEGSRLLGKEILQGNEAVTWSKILHPEPISL